MKYTDTQMLDWLDSQGNGDTWIARESTTGRGFRLHNTRHLHPHNRITVREAIETAMDRKGADHE